MRRDADWLADILDAVENIKRYAARGRPAYDADELIRAWMVQQIQVIGEAVSHLSPELLAAHPDVPWREIVDMRHLVVHGYFHVDAGIVWRVIERDVPVLEASVRSILEGPG